MKNQPIHENLDTSFVNLSALVRFLRRRNFVGRVTIQLSGYEAEVILDDGNQISVREHDQIAGRKATGEEALQRLLVRSRDPGGIVNVYQFIKEEGEVIKMPSAAPNGNIAGNAKFNGGNNSAGSEADASRGNANGKPPAPVKIPSDGPLKPAPSPESIQRPAINQAAAPQQKQTSLPDFPFNLSNNVEQKARMSNLPPQDWQVLLQLTSELIATLDKTLDEANLNFPAALDKARIEIADDYPFLNPHSDNFRYEKGKIFMKEQVNHKLYVASLNEILRRMLEKLGANPKFAEIHRIASQRIIALLRHRKAHYDRFSITPQLEKILGL